MAKTRHPDMHIQSAEDILNDELGRVAARARLAAAETAALRMRLEALQLDHATLGMMFDQALKMLPAHQNAALFEHWKKVKAGEATPDAFQPPPASGT